MNKSQIICFCLFFGCVNTPVVNTHNIIDWQQREQKCPNIHTPFIDAETLYGALIDLRDQFPMIQYSAQNQEIWKTSEQTLNDLQGDCEDIAALFYRAIIDSCIPNKFDIDVRLRIINVGESQHCLIIIYYDLETYEFDYPVVRTSESPFPVIAEYDLWNIF